MYNIIISCLFLTIMSTTAVYYIFDINWLLYLILHPSKSYSGNESSLMSHVCCLYVVILFSFLVPVRLHTYIVAH